MYFRLITVILLLPGFAFGSAWHYPDSDLDSDLDSSTKGSSTSQELFSPPPVREAYEELYKLRKNSTLLCFDLLSFSNFLREQHQKNLLQTSVSRVSKIHSVYIESTNDSQCAFSLPQIMHLSTLIAPLNEDVFENFSNCFNEIIHHFNKASWKELIELSPTLISLEPWMWERHKEKLFRINLHGIHKNWPKLVTFVLSKSEQEVEVLLNKYHLFKGTFPREITPYDFLKILDKSSKVDWETALERVKEVWNSSHLDFIVYPLFVLVAEYPSPSDWGEYITRINDFFLNRQKLNKYTNSGINFMLRISTLSSEEQSETLSLIESMVPPSEVSVAPVETALSYLLSVPQHRRQEYVQRLVEFPNFHHDLHLTNRLIPLIWKVPSKDWDKYRSQISSYLTETPRKLIAHLEGFRSVPAMNLKSFIEDLAPIRNKTIPPIIHPQLGAVLSTTPYRRFWAMRMEAIMFGTPSPQDQIFYYEISHKFRERFASPKHSATQEDFFWQQFLLNLKIICSRGIYEHKDEALLQNWILILMSYNDRDWKCFTDMVFRSGNTPLERLRRVTYIQRNWQGNVYENQNL